MAYCPAIKDSCQHFSFDKCQIRHPVIRKDSGRYWCKSHSMSKEVKDLSAATAISEGPRFES
jgi:hypothetical protein